MGGFSLTTQSLSSTPGWPRTSQLRVRTSSLWRRWSPLLENSRTSSSRRRSWLRTCNPDPNFLFRLRQCCTISIPTNFVTLSQENLTEAVILFYHENYKRFKEQRVDTIFEKRTRDSSSTVH